jgi:hypothetical protein
LAKITASGPIPAIQGVGRWRIVDLSQWLWQEFRVSVARQTLSRDARALGYAGTPSSCRITSAPLHHHPANTGADTAAGWSATERWIRPP